MRNRLETANTSRPFGPVKSPLKYHIIGDHKNLIFALRTPTSLLSPRLHSRSLLQAAFEVEQHVVGLMDKADSGTSGTESEQGVVVPLSLACRAPQVIFLPLMRSEKQLV